MPKNKKKAESPAKTSSVSRRPKHKGLNKYTRQVFTGVMREVSGKHAFQPLPSRQDKPPMPFQYRIEALRDKIHEYIRDHRETLDEGREIRIRGILREKPQVGTVIGELKSKGYTASCDGDNTLVVKKRKR